MLFRLLRYLFWFIVGIGFLIGLYVLFFSAWRDLTFGRVHRLANDMFHAPGNITEVQIILLEGEPKDRTDQTFRIRVDGIQAPIFGETRLKGEELKTFLGQWYDQEVTHTGGGLCHNPPYGFRFYSHGIKTFETTVCWGCSNFTVEVWPYYASYYGFHADRQAAKDLLAFCDQRLPYRREASPAKPSKQ